jgi:hypothetical protein
VHNTPLTKLRRAAPGSLTLADLRAFFARKRYPRALPTLSSFERGVYKDPPRRFLEVYAEAIGLKDHVGRVEDALRETQRLRARAAGPFVERRVNAA